MKQRKPKIVLTLKKLISLRMRRFTLGIKIAPYLQVTISLTNEVLLRKLSFDDIHSSVDYQALEFVRHMTAHKKDYFDSAVIYPVATPKSHQQNATIGTETTAYFNRPWI